MSAWLVSKNHIDVLVTWAIDAHLVIPFEDLVFSIDKGNANSIGQQLWKENYDSINCRYNEYNMVPNYEFKENFYPAISVLKQIECYDYQTCECSDYEKSFPYAFVKAALAKMEEFRINSDDPLYKKAPWGID
jgi:hypothetical protein